MRISDWSSDVCSSDLADQPVARQGVVEHRQVAGLEDIERQATPRQQQHTLQREDRQHPRQLVEGGIEGRAAHANSSEENRRRFSIVSGSVGPQASKKTGSASGRERVCTYG